MALKRKPDKIRDFAGSGDIPVGGDDSGDGTKQAHEELTTKTGEGDMECEEDDLESLAQLAADYALGGWSSADVEEDYAKAFHFATRAKENGLGQLILGACYQEGWGVERDYDNAILCFELCKEEFPSQANNNLGNIYSERGQYLNAMEYYRAASALQNSTSQNGLAMCFKLAGDFVSARHYFTLAAEGEEEDENAQYELGLMMMKGEGGARSFGEGFKLVKLAAKQGKEGAKEYVANFMNQFDE